MKIKVSKGLNINLEGIPEKQLSEFRSPNLVAIKPTDFPNLMPKMLVKEGHKVKCGSPIFSDKYNENIVFASPVSGEVKEIVRGAKRKILAVTIISDGSFEQTKSSGVDFNNMNVDEIKSELMSIGLWPYFRMRPIDIIANPSDKPKSIFISSFDTNPLSPDYNFLMSGKSAEFNAGLEVISKLTEGNIHLQVRPDSDKVFTDAPNVQINVVTGPHPAGNVGVQIHKIDTLNKGEVVWYINPQDVMIIGRYSLTGAYDASKIIAIGGSNITERKYIKTISGARISSIINKTKIKDNSRVISGNALSGEKVDSDDFLGFYHQQITVIPEGNQHKFFLTDGWLSAGFNKLSASKAYPSWLMPKSKNYNLDTNLNGEERAFVVSGQYEKVFPFDIFPVQLIKSIMTNDIEKMENLGIYEVAPEDFALCEFVCTSKINVQEIVRSGLDLVYKECM